MNKKTPIHEVFAPRAQNVMHMMRIYGAESLQGFSNKEDLRVEQLSDSGGGITLRYWRRKVIGHKQRQAFVEIGNIQAVDPEKVVFGPETTSKKEVLSVRKEPVTNHGYADIEVDLANVFGKESGDETTKEAGGGAEVKTTITEEAGVEGVEKFTAGIETTIKAEFSESKSHTETTSHDLSGDEKTTVPPGKSVMVTETRSRADTSQEVSAYGDFTHSLKIGTYTHKVKPEHKWSSVEWKSWGAVCRLRKR